MFQKHVKLFLDIACALSFPLSTFDIVYLKRSFSSNHWENIFRELEISLSNT